MDCDTCLDSEMNRNGHCMVRHCSTVKLWPNAATPGGWTAHEKNSLPVSPGVHSAVGRLGVLTGTVTQTQRTSAMVTLVISPQLRVLLPLPIELLMFDAPCRFSGSLQCVWKRLRRQTQQWFPSLKKRRRNSLSNRVQLMVQEILRKPNRILFLDKEPYKGISYYRLQAGRLWRNVYYLISFAIKYNETTDVN